jgi:hypothetical protein
MNVAGEPVRAFWRVPEIPKQEQQFGTLKDFTNLSSRFRLIEFPVTFYHRRCNLQDVI